MTRSPFGMADNTLAVADLTMDCAHTVRRGGREIALSAKEYALLEYLLRNRGIVLSGRRSKTISGISSTRAARTWWTYTSAICGRK